MDSALTAISCRGGSPFCPLSLSTSNSMWEYANNPIRHTYNFLLFDFAQRFFYQRQYINIYIYIFQWPQYFGLPANWVPSRDTGFATIPVCFWIISKKFSSKSTNEKKTAPLKFSHGVKFHIVRYNMCFYLNYQKNVFYYNRIFKDHWISRL